MNRRMDKKKQKTTARQSATPAAATATAPVQPKAREISFYIQYQDQEYLQSAVTEKVIADCQAQGCADTDSLAIYLKPEDRKAYYTCGTVSGFVAL